MLDRFKNVSILLVKYALIIIVIIAIIIFSSMTYWGVKREQDIKESQALSESIVNYEIEGYKFRLSGKYLSNVLRFRPGKTRALWLEGQLPDFSVRTPIPDKFANVTDPERVTVEIFKRVNPNSMTEFVPVSYDASTRTVLENGWVRYESDLGFLYYKNLNSSDASYMRCSAASLYPNPLCRVKYYLNDKLEVNIGFSLSRWQNWQEIEDNVRIKIIEFMASD